MLTVPERNSLYVRVPDPHTGSFNSDTPLYEMTFDMNGISFEETKGAHDVPILDIMSVDGKQENGLHFDIVQRYLEKVFMLKVPMISVVLTWGYTMVWLQLLMLVLLTFEPVYSISRETITVSSEIPVYDPILDSNTTLQYTDVPIDNVKIMSVGLVDDRYMIRFISENIDSHRGYASGMLLSFTGSFILLVCVAVEGGVALGILFLVCTAAFGGVGVVVFHGKWHTTHIVCAILFITSGILAHYMVAVTGPWKRNATRDTIMFMSTVLSAVSFVLFYFLAYSISDDNRHDERHHVRLMWWIAGISEYILYVTMSILNAYLPQRITEHIAFRVTQELPTLIYALKEKTV